MAPVRCPQEALATPTLEVIDGFGAGELELELQLCAGHQRELSQITSEIALSHAMRAGTYGDGPGELPQPCEHRINDLTKRCGKCWMTIDEIAARGA